VSEANAPSVFSPGTLLGNTYIIEEHLARGGIGEVYRAKHVELETEHAIQVMLPSLAEDPRIVQVFREEARKLGRIKNDAVVDYQGFFRDERGLRYLVTEFVHGERLAEVLSRRRLELDEVLRLRDRLAFGLAAAHEMGIVHRGLSPENILLPEGRIDRAKLIGFGIASIAKSTDFAALTIIGSDFAGKYSYVSPEQVGLFDGRVDLRSDIYSLGLVLAAAAIGFGRKLDMGNSVPTVIAARKRVPDLSEVPAPLRLVIARMLEPRPDDRPPSLRPLFTGLPAPAVVSKDGGIDVFVSFCNEDETAANEIVDTLEGAGFACWIANRDVWQNYQEEIVDAIKAAKVMVIVFSANANRSDEIKKELSLAGRYKLPKISVRVEDTAPQGAFEYEFSTSQYIDLFKNRESGIGRLTQAVRRVI
jgi:serine/threonine protein kinase